MLLSAGDSAGDVRIEEVRTKAEAINTEVSFSSLNPQVRMFQSLLIPELPPNHCEGLCTP